MPIRAYCKFSLNLKQVVFPAEALIVIALAVAVESPAAAGGGGWHCSSCELWAFGDALGFLFWFLPGQRMIYVLAVRQYKLSQANRPPHFHPFLTSVT
jgi:hypothetical protein